MSYSAPSYWTRAVLPEREITFSLVPALRPMFPYGTLMETRCVRVIVPAWRVALGDADAFESILSDEPGADDGAAGRRATDA